MTQEAPIRPEINEQTATQLKNRLLRPKIGIAIIGFIAIAGLAILATTRRPKWEYKTISITSESHSRTGDSAGKYATVTPSQEELNALGKDGWQLVSSYLEMETAWINFGNEEYVTGLQPNVRPQRAVLIFKRERSIFSKE